MRNQKRRKVVGEQGGWKEGEEKDVIEIIKEGERGEDKQT